MKFTFAVCSQCGVQSQPIIIPVKPSPVFVREKLEKDGWEVNFDLHLFIARCPSCKAN